MKFHAQPLIAFVIASTSIGVSEKSFAEPYLFEMLDKPKYMQAWNNLFMHEKNIASWLGTYAKTRDAPASLGKMVSWGGVEYQINYICKPHDCGDNQFYVLFSSDRSKAWGLFVKQGSDQRFFGSPDMEQKEILRTAAHGE